MEPGQGYLIYATTNTTLTYPAGAATVATGAADRVESNAGLCPAVAPTPTFALLYGDLIFNGAPVPVGARVEALTASGVVAGCIVVTQAGKFGFLPLFGTDGGTNPTPGYADGGQIRLRVNGALIPTPETLRWSDTKEPQRVNLDVTGTWQVDLPLVAR